MKRANMGSVGNSAAIDPRDLERLSKVIGNESTQAGIQGMEFLTPYDLYRRWAKAISLKTLANWRSMGMGPPYSKLGGKVVYRGTDVLTWENQKRFITRM